MRTDLTGRAPPRPAGHDAATVRREALRAAGWWRIGATRSVGVGSCRRGPPLRRPEAGLGRGGPHRHPARHLDRGAPRGESAARRLPARSGCTGLTAEGAAAPGAVRGQPAGHDAATVRRGVLRAAGWWHIGATRSVGVGSCRRGPPLRRPEAGLGRGGPHRHPARHLDRGAPRGASAARRLPARSGCTGLTAGGRRGRAPPAAGAAGGAWGPRAARFA